MDYARIRRLRHRFASTARTIKTQPYPRADRDEAVRLCREMAAAGMSLRESGEQLGLNPSTLRRWCLTATSSRTFAEIVVRRETEVTIASTPRELSVVSPSGWRIEGLELSQVSMLLGDLS